jgi:hypothetical protein
VKRYPWPQTDLSASVEVARVIVDPGGGELDKEQLAKLLGYTSANSGTFLSKLAAARQFGLLDGRSPELRPTRLALDILEPSYPDARENALFKAFVSVPLFRDVFNRFKGRAIPGNLALERALKDQFGVPAKQTGFVRARFLNSADQAGLFNGSGNRTRMAHPLEKPGNQPGDRPSLRGPFAGVPNSIIGTLEAVPWGERAIEAGEVDLVLEAIRRGIDLHNAFLRESSAGSAQTR